MGVVRDVRQAASDEDLSDLYVPLLQTPGRFAWMYLRTSESPLAWLPAIRSAFKEIDPLTLGITSAAFAVAGYMAVWWPARRAALTDPAAALKED